VLALVPVSLDRAPDPRATVWIRHELALRAFRAAAAALREQGVPVVPVKGILLSRRIYAEVTERPFLDVDLLITRSAWQKGRRALVALGKTLYESTELGELTVDVHGVHVELHTEIGRLEMTDLVVEDLVARALPESETFGFPILRIDDVDHALFVVANAVKDGLARTPAHVPDDLERLLARVEISALVERARAAAFVTGLHCAAHWMVHVHGSEPWRRVLLAIGPPRRRMYARALGAFARSRGTSWSVAVALGCWSNDRPAMRVRALGRLIRRNAVKLVGRTPP
jgi:hypothetical protein